MKELHHDLLNRIVNNCEVHPDEAMCAEERHLVPGRMSAEKIKLRNQNNVSGRFDNALVSDESRIKDLLGFSRQTRPFYDNKRHFSSWEEVWEEESETQDLSAKKFKDL